jgi:hypothetical protein
MPDPIEDLWPDLNPIAIVTPASILKTQAAALSQKTRGLLQGEVETWSAEQTIYHQLTLVVPALENYRYSLLRIHHSPTLYPVYVDQSPFPVVEGQRTDWNAELGRTTYVVQDEGTFRAWLRHAFAAPETKRILESLLAQASS